MYWIRTNLRKFQLLNVKCNIEMFILHYIMSVLIICAVLVPYMSSQKGEFRTIQVHVGLTTSVLVESILLVTLMHVLSLIMKIYGKSK